MKPIKRIEVKKIFKKFNTDSIRQVGALSFFVDYIFRRKKNKKYITVAEDISFEVNSGEILGIIGRNGAGKSSLLRIIAGIYKTDSGTVQTHGRVVYLSGLGHGLASRLTVKENILLMGSILGLNQRDITGKINEIVEFAGLQDFLDMKIQQLSTGMISRLIFSVTIFCIHHQKPDILLLDEVLSSGGDIDFQRKVTGKIEHLIKDGAAVIIVSHDVEFLKKYCHEIIWVDKGYIKLKDDSKKVAEKYLTNY